jgi:hypothetical protein
MEKIQYGTKEEIKEQIRKNDEEYVRLRLEMQKLSNIRLSLTNALECVEKEETDDAL